MKTLLVVSSAAVALVSASRTPWQAPPTGAEHVETVVETVPELAPRVDTVLIRADLDEADRALALASASGMLEALADTFTDDVVLLYPGQPIVQGRGIAIAMLEDVPAARRIRMTWRAVRGDISADGTRAYTAGYGRSTVAGAADSAHVRYITYWRRTGHRWRVAAFVVTRSRAGGSTSAPAGCVAHRAAASNARSGAREVREVREGREAHQALEHALLATDSAFAGLSVRDGAAAAFGTFAAPDGATLGGLGEMVCGREALARAMAGIGAGELVWTPRIADAAGSGDLGFTAGTAASGGVSGRTYTKYLTIWRKQDDGSWRFVADGGNAAPAP